LKKYSYFAMVFGDYTRGKLDSTNR